MTLLCINPKCPKHTPVRMAALYPGSTEQVLRYAEGHQLKVSKTDLKHFNPTLTANWCETCATARAWTEEFSLLTPTL